jgi:hypothetical protein
MLDKASKCKYWRSSHRRGPGVLHGVSTVVKVVASRRVSGKAVAAGVVAALVAAADIGLVLEDRQRNARADGSLPPSQPARASTTPTPTPPPVALLLPNMRSIRANDLQIETVGTERRLRFEASLANVGSGPLLLLPRGRGPCPASQHQAVQVLYRDANADGVFQRSTDPAARRQATGCMLRHPGHNHWHFDAMAAYSLRRPGTDQVLVSRDKVSFCLRDNRRVPGQRVVVRREHFGKCSRNSQQGISPGWVDVYTADLNGQWPAFPDEADGQLLCLDLKADPLGRITEANETDNATSVGLRVNGTEIHTVGTEVCR